MSIDVTERQGEAPETESGLWKHWAGEHSRADRLNI